VYDDANRLTSAGGVTYTWDANGNLLSDGIKTYTYDSANRLKAVSGQQLAVSYGYNGLGDRLQETLNGRTTNFTKVVTQMVQFLSDSRASATLDEPDEQAGLLEEEDMESTPAS